MKPWIIAALPVLAIALWPATAGAKQKKVSNGCTLAQIQSPAASNCINQLEQDVLHDRPTIHALYCSSTGRILCCEFDGGNIVDHSCTVVGRMLPKVPRGNLENLQTLQPQ
jgi:hypothetical protein